MVEPAHFSVQIEWRMVTPAGSTISSSLSALHHQDLDLPWLPSRPEVIEAALVCRLRSTSVFSSRKSCRLYQPTSRSRSMPVVGTSYETLRRAVDTVCRLTDRPICTASASNCISAEGATLLSESMLRRVQPASLLETSTVLFFLVKCRRSLRYIHRGG